MSSVKYLSVCFKEKALRKKILAKVTPGMHFCQNYFSISSGEIDLKWTRMDGAQEN